ncbi:AzlC family ABC transporter permease [Treponema sp.]|uniref:AzlC family ABC transporter permease n=1 Tax=Treponema sp. TaxID=166 RepID=UPI00388EAE31
MNKNMLLHALKVTMPVFFGYISIGIPFGLLVVNAGYPWWLSPLMGVAMFTGAGQFFAIALFSTGTVLSVIVLAEFLLSIRHIFYGLSLIDRYKKHIRRRPYLMYSITDETFALVTTVDVPAGVDAGKFYNLVSFLDQSYWVIGCTIGAGAYKILEAYNLTQYLAGVDFALTALFVVLAVEQIISRHDVLGPVVGALICGFTVWLFKAGRFDSSGIIWVSICFGLTMLFLLRGKSYYRNSRGENGNVVPSEEKETVSKSGALAALASMVIFAVLFLLFSKPHNLLSEGTSRLSLAAALVAVFASGAVVLATRILPFAVFAKKNPPLFIRFIEKYAPPLIMMVLLVYCFKDVDYSSAALCVPYFVCVATVGIIHVIFRNSMASIIGSTVLFMLLSRLWT